MKTNISKIIASGFIIVIVLISNVFAAQADAKRIAFKRGTSSATVKGTVAKGGPDFYVIGAKAGQTIKIKTVGKVSFGVDSVDGTNLTNDDSNKTLTKKIPEDGDYTIRVYSFGGVNNYSLTVSIK